MSDEKQNSSEMKEIITKAKELFESIKKGVNKLILDVSAKLPKSEEKPSSPPSTTSKPSTPSAPHTPINHVTPEIKPEMPPATPEIKPEMPPKQPQDPVPPIKPEPPIVADAESKKKPPNDMNRPE